MVQVHAKRVLKKKLLKPAMPCRRPQPNRYARSAFPYPGILAACFATVYRGAEPHAHDVLSCCNACLVQSRTLRRACQLSVLVRLHRVFPLLSLAEAHKLAASTEILLWMTPSEAPKALQASECSELLDPMRASCWIFAQH